MFRMGLFTLLFCLHGNYLFKATGEEVFHLKLQTQVKSENEGFYSILHRKEKWSPNQTAIIVCDVWDYHHCFNAVKRLGQFAPRLNEVIAEARRRGCVVIHAPSDCMDAYKKHPARLRAAQTPKAEVLPHEITQWCSQIPAEEMAVYPIDQSDGGEDDDPVEHAKWAKQLEELGRNPKMPWKRQLETIEIDAEGDYISDQGDEVWSILEARGIRNVILTGVHVNMCVLGRPFGLRQLARNGKNVVLMRDMTDSMYNPKQWPYVSHHEGTRRIISHIERHVCPTLTSDQIIGGVPFTWAKPEQPDENTQSNKEDHDSYPNDARKHWVKVRLNRKPFEPIGKPQEEGEVTWFRSVVKVPDGKKLQLALPSESGSDAWLDGVSLNRCLSGGGLDIFAMESIEEISNDYHLIAIKTRHPEMMTAPFLYLGQEEMELLGGWEYRIAGQDVESLRQIPLPAKFGGSPDVVFESVLPKHIPRTVTKPFEFTSGIEGPACDSKGNVYAVNLGRQGTIGMVSPEGVASVLVDLPEGSVGNGIRFDSMGNMYVADYTRHQILKVNAATGDTTVHAHEPRMNQPNDLAVAADGLTLYASDPNWQKGDGQIWKIDPDGTCTAVAKGMGTTNGIEVSPNGKILYVNETKQRKIWKFKIGTDGQLESKTLFKEFVDHGMDGMRCDIDGNLYVTRYGKGTVVKLSPQGNILTEFNVLGMRPSNLCFGGPDRSTLYVTEVEYQRLVSIRVARPGRE